MASFCTGQPGQHAHSVRRFDFYATPAIAVTALLDANPEHLNPSSVRVWDPAAGDGGTVVPLRERGFAVICSDVVARGGFPLHFVADFFSLTCAPAGITTILTNPPYREAQRFPTQTLTAMKRARARADRHRNGAARVLTKMQDGATLHLCFTNSGPIWSLSDETKVAADIAKIVTDNINVMGVGDRLVPGCHHHLANAPLARN